MSKMQFKADVDDGEIRIGLILPLDSIDYIIAEGKLGVEFDMPSEGAQQIVDHIQEAINKIKENPDGDVPTQPEGDPVP